MNSIHNPIVHQQSSHCETGVVSNLLKSHGFPISETMVFGLAGALTFAYLPFIKLSGMPLIAYRSPPRSILRTTTKRLGVEVKVRKFRNPEAGMQALDEALAAGHLVGLQTSVYWLPYFPDDMRFHFNAHNLIVYGKNQKGNYLISDPVFEEVTECKPDDLVKARFAKGALAPKGLMYTISAPPSNTDLSPHIYAGIKSASRMMNGIPIPGISFFGYKGISLLSRQIRRLASKPFKYQKLYLTHIVRMQEEIGTGGAGFRFMYAGFLQESAQITGDLRLDDLSNEVTALGDRWREFASQAVHYCKKRTAIDLNSIADALCECAKLENQLRIKLSKIRPIKELEA